MIRKDKLPDQNLFDQDDQEVGLPVGLSWPARSNNSIKKDELPDQNLFDRDDQEVGLPVGLS